MRRNRKSDLYPKKCTTYTQSKKQTIEIDSEWAQILEGINKDFKAVIINTFEELKETMLKN